MDADLAVNYSIRKWLRHNRRYPSKEYDQAMERGCFAAFVVMVIIPMLAVWIALVIITTSDFKGEVPLHVDMQDLIFEGQFAAPPMILCLVSFFEWRGFRRRRLSEL